MSTTTKPTPAIAVSASATLAERAVNRMLSPAARAGLGLTVAGTTVLPREREICRSEHGDWLFVSYQDDPTAKYYGGKIPVPTAERQRLAALKDAGVRPDLIWLAHELPVGWDETQQLPNLVPVPPHLRRHDEALTRTLRNTAMAAGLLAATAIAAPLAIGAVAIAGMLDPIVLGGVKHPNLPVVQWAVLAQWTWE
jgi:hypothetical protein